MSEDRARGKSKRRLGALSVVLAAGLVAGYSIQRARAAGIPASQAMTYSGVLTNAAGTPLTGSKNIQISLYSAATAGTLLCTVGPGAITLNNGGFQIPLPDSCTAGVHATPDAWIEVFADGASLGRTKLGVVPYAVEADHAATAAAAQAVNATVGGSLVGTPPAGTKFTWQASVTGILDHETAAGFTVVLGANQVVRINWMALGW